MPSKVPEGQHRGVVIPIGGAEDKIDDSEILRRFIHLCGSQPAIAVIPTASMLADTGEQYQRLFLDLGANKAPVINVVSRADCGESAVLSSIENADGVFITGGNQLRLSTIFGGTPAAQLLRKRNASGMPVAGTSAGAAIMPEHMIAGGETGSTPRADMVTLAPGLGLSNKIIIDQHFRQRDRIGRLLAALSYNPFPVGLGIDEDTAVIIDGDNSLEVFGSGSVTVIDPSQLRHTSAAAASSGDALCMVDLRLHVLTDGCRYDLSARQAIVQTHTTH